MDKNMSNDQRTDRAEGAAPPVQGLTDTAVPKTGRRRFLGVGAGAAPALLTLASQPALGVTCFTPSRSLSRNTSISQQGKYGDCLRAESPGNYQAQQDPSKGAYHWPTSVPPSTPFHPLFYGQRFMTGAGAARRSMTLGEVLNLQGNEDPEKVAKHLIGAYLNIHGGNGAVIPANVLTAANVLTIWQEWETKRYYEPVAGVQWGGTQIKNYLLNNGIII